MENIGNLEKSIELKQKREMISSMLCWTLRNDKGRGGISTLIRLNSSI